MNYRHIYHAGNFADVYKHWILSLIMQHLVSKDKPFAVLDTHAGLGIYDLTCEQAEKTREYSNGINKLLAITSVPATFEVLCAQVRALNQDTTLRYYPGSPRLIQQFLRDYDELHLCELHPQDYYQLKANFTYAQQVHIHHRDAYEAIKALVPFKQGRGLVFIDPPYEVPDELTLIANALALSYPRFSHGIYAIWYPIKSYSTVTAFYQKIHQYIPQKILACEFVLQSLVNPDLLNGCGMLIINPPWQLAQTIDANSEFLLQCFAKDKKAYAKTLSM